MNRPLRSRMRGGVGRVGEKPALTRFIKSLAFKKALFGIWLSDNPVQKTLYKEMLGGGLENRLFN